MFSFFHFFSHVFVLARLVALVSANAEKTIFLGTSAGDVALSSDLLSSLPLPPLPLDQLPRLDPAHRRWRTLLPRAFSWDSHGVNTTWILLDGLTPGQRYEARVCWAATQPTEFWIDTFPAKGLPVDQEDLDDLDNRLLLRIVAVADYVAADRTLMRPDQVPPVLVDVVLDPYLGNVLPASLAPTVGCIVVVALTSAVLARQFVAPLLRGIAQDATTKKRD